MIHKEKQVKALSSNDLRQNKGRKHVAKMLCRTETDLREQERKIYEL